MISLGFPTPPGYPALRSASIFTLTPVLLLPPTSQPPRLSKKIPTSLAAAAASLHPPQLRRHRHFPSPLPQRPRRPSRSAALLRCVRLPYTGRAPQRHPPSSAASTRLLRQPPLRLRRKLRPHRRLPPSSSPPGTSSATSTAARSSGLHAPNFTNPSAASAARSPAPELHRRLSRQREGYRWTRRSRSQSPPASQTCSCNGAAGSGSDASSHAKTARRRQPGRMRSGAPYPGSIGPFLEGMSHSFVHHAARALCHRRKSEAQASEGQAVDVGSRRRRDRYYSTRGSPFPFEGNGFDFSGGVEEKGTAALPRFFISLSNKEKEEDFMAMKGCKLPQRPKKRPKLMQKCLLTVCPGAWLSDLSHERYEVREKKSSKKRARGLKALCMESDSE